MKTMCVIYLYSSPVVIRLRNEFVIKLIESLCKDEMENYIGYIHTNLLSKNKYLLIDRLRLSGKLHLWEIDKYVRQILKETK